MARAKADKPFANYIGGFVTEATGLSYPENTARDLDNVDIYLSGVVRRRLGLTEEVYGTTVSPGTFNSEVGFPDHDAELAITVHEWNGVAGQANLNFLVIQHGRFLHISNRAVDPVSETAPSITLIQTPTLNVQSFAFSGSMSELGLHGIDWHRLHSTSGNGRLWMAAPSSYPFYLEYDPVTQTISAQKVGKAYKGSSERYLGFRDFYGHDRGSTAPTDTPAVLTDEHFYNIINRGWFNTAIASFVHDGNDHETGFYPALSQVWFLGKEPDGDFAPYVLDRNSLTSEAATGNIILDPLSGRILNQEVKYNEGYKGPIFGGVAAEATRTTLNGRALVSPLPGSDRSFATCAWYAGRLWIAGNVNTKASSNLFFSQVVESPEQAGLFYSVNNPTDEHFPDVLATDGGVINLGEADGIMKMVPAGIGMLVFARNGVWFVRGDEGGFSATTYTVDRVSTIGCTSAQSILSFEDKVVYWSAGGAYQVQFNNGLANSSSSISDATIRTHFQRIPLAAKEHATGFVDELTKKMYWLWLEADSYNYPVDQSKNNRALILDLRTGAWTKYSLPVYEEEANLWLSAGFAKKKSGFPAQEEIVVDNAGVTVVDNSGDVVVVYSDEPYFDTTSNIKLVAQLDLLYFKVMEFSSLTFLDFGNEVLTAQDYSSYVETAPETLGDLQRNKGATYVHSFFRKTETGFVTGPGGILLADHPSGCLLRGKWDWHNTSAGGRWNDSQQAYKTRRPYQPVDANDTFDTGEEIVYTKRKMRGKGRSLSLRYESETGKDFQLLGFSIAISSNGE